MRCNFFFRSVKTKEGYTDMCSINVIEIDGTKHWYVPNPDEINKYCDSNMFCAYFECPRIIVSRTYILEPGNSNHIFRISKS